MEAFVAFKYLHVVSMFFAVALAVSGELVMRRVAASVDPVAIRTMITRIQPISRAADGFFVAGVAFGIVAALTGQFSLLAPWLLASYVLVASALAIGVLVIGPWVSRLEAATAVTAGGGSSDLQAVVDEPVARFGTWGLMAIIATLVFLMVVKPFA